MFPSRGYESLQIEFSNRFRELHCLDFPICNENIDADISSARRMLDEFRIRSPLAIRGGGGGQ